MAVFLPTTFWQAIHNAVVAVHQKKYRGEKQLCNFIV